MGEKISFIDLFGTELELEDEYAREQLNNESAARAEDVAVLEARMDTFTALPAGSTAGNAELMDIRVGADGATYANAGDAVRAQAFKPGLNEDGSVNHFVLADESTAKYDAGSLVNLDETVSLAGYAPDAKAVGDKVTELKSALVPGYITGYNIWDEQWEIGEINSSNGQNNDSSTFANMIRSKNYIPVLPETEYFFCFTNASSGSSARVRFYGADKSYIGYQAYGGASVYNNALFKTPTGCYFMRFASDATYGTTYNNDYCINYSQPDTAITPHNGQYVKYIANDNLLKRIFDNSHSSETANNNISSGSPSNDIPLENGYRNLSGYKIGDYISGSNTKTALIPVLEGEIYLVKGTGGPSYLLWGTANENKTIMRVEAATHQTQKEVTITIQAGERYLCFNAENTSAAIAFKRQGIIQGMDVIKTLFPKTKEINDSLLDNWYFDQIYSKLKNGNAAVLSLRYTNGNWTNSYGLVYLSSKCVSNLVPLFDGVQISVTVPSGCTKPDPAWFDKDRVFISNSATKPDNAYYTAVYVGKTNITPEEAAGATVTLSMPTQNDDPVSVKNLFVGTGHKYAAIQDAVDAWQAMGEPDGTIITVGEGTYNEDVLISPSTFNHLEIVGTLKTACIVETTTGLYANAPFYITGGNITLKNLTIIASHPQDFDFSDNASKAYAVHIDSSSKPGTGMMEIINCICTSYQNAALGLGSNEGQTIRIMDCECTSYMPSRNVADPSSTYYTETYKNGAILYHTKADQNSPTNFEALMLINCTFTVGSENLDGRVFRYANYSSNGSKKELLVNNCTFTTSAEDKTYAFYAGSIAATTTPYYNLAEQSSGNNVSALNF